jgi:PAS domain S-box-containing protein
LLELEPAAVDSGDAESASQESNGRATELRDGKPMSAGADQKISSDLKLVRLDGRFMLHDEFPISNVVRSVLPAVFDAEVVTHRPDGTQLTLIVNIRPKKYDSEEITGVINCFYDLADRKQTDEVLLLANAAMEAAGNAIFITDCGGIIEYTNPAFTTLTGYVAAEAIGKKASLVRSDCHGPAFYRDLWQTVLAGAVWRGQITNRRKDGTLYDTDQTIAPVKDLKGEIIHFVSIQEDTTLRKQAEHAQHRAEVLAASNQKLEIEIVHRHTVEDALRTSQANLEDLLKSSQQMQEHLRQLTHQLLMAQEEERKRISRELHDVTAQTLTGINLRLELLQKENYTSIKELLEKLAQAQELVIHSVDTVHRFARDLRPAMLDDLGLIPALEVFLKDFIQQTGIQANLKSEADVEELGSLGRTVLYRVAQEALSNVARHANATRVDVKLRKHEGKLSMAITDNGQGFAMDDASLGNSSRRLGMLGMCERVEIVGGTFSVSSVQGQHTTVKVEIPIDSNDT